jgi:hypothetical protein
VLEGPFPIHARTSYTQSARTATPDRQGLTEPASAAALRTCGPDPAMR